MHTHVNGKSTAYSLPMLHAHLALTLADLRYRFGDGAVMTFADKPLAVEAMSTGFSAIDTALGVGGVPRGRITDIYGPESSGKTALCLSIITQAQRRGLWCVYIDTDHALDPLWAVRRWGVNPDQLYYAAPESAECALEIAREVIRAGAAVVVIDSAAALTPQDEIEGEMGDEWTNHGRLMSDALRNLAGPVGKNKTALIFTNQMRQNDRSVAKCPGPTGGYALRFYASIRIYLNPVWHIRPDDQYTGIRVRAVVKKNKVAPPFRETEFDLLY